MRLAGAGHRDVFEYGWSAFVEALEAEAQLRDLPSGGTLSHPWGVLTINMDSYGMDTPFPVRGAFP